MNTKTIYKSEMDASPNRSPGLIEEQKPRIIHFPGSVIALWLLFGLLLFLPGQLMAGAGTPDFIRTANVVYWRQQGQDLTLDVFKPTHPNGAGLLWMISGGWMSSTNAIVPAVAEPFISSKPQAPSTLSKSGRPVIWEVWLVALP